MSKTSSQELCQNNYDQHVFADTLRTRSYFVHFEVEWTWYRSHTRGRSHYLMTKKHHLTSSCLFEHHLQWIACHRSRESPVEEICGNFLSEEPSFESDASVVLTTVNVANW